MVDAARIGGPIGCLGLALLLAAPQRIARIVGLALWAIGGLLLVLYLVPSGHHRVLAAGVVAGAAAVGVGVWILRRWPWALAFAALACVPARIPVSVGSTDANLLLPLYVVVGAAAVVLALELLRGDERYRELGRLAWPLAALACWTGVTLLWTNDVRQGAIDLAAFWLPFGLLALSLARLPWSRRALAWLYAELAAMALVFALVGIYQWTNRDVFWNPKVKVDNAYAPSGYFFRVNSVFYDPSIYGRFLVVAILASLVLVLFGFGRRQLIAAAALIAATWVGLLFSFSQSSFAALIVGVLLAAAIAWRWRAAAAVGLVAVVLIPIGASAPRVRHTLVTKSGHGLNAATSGRYGLISNGIRISLAHPLGGVGVGGFRRAYADRTHLRGKEPKKAASHDTPVTVAAETGFPGLALFVWLVAAVLLAALRPGARTVAARTSLIVGLGFAAVTVHSLFYNAFFEDPLTFGLIAVAALAVGAAAREEPVA